MSSRNLSLLVKFAALDKLTQPLRGIRSGSRDAGKAIAETRREIRALNQEQARAGGLRDLRKGLTDTTAKLRAARGRVQELTRAIESTSGPTTRLAQQLAAAQRQEAKLSAEHRTQATRLREVSQEFRRAGVNVRDLASHEQRLADRVGAATRRLAEQREQLERNARARKRLDDTRETGERMRSGGVRAMATGAVMAAPLVAAGRSAADFESRMTDIAQKAHLTREQAEQMGRAIDALGPRVAQLPADLAAAADALAGFGMEAPRTLEVLPDIGRAGTAYRAELDELARASWATIDNLRVPISETGRTLDVMAEAGKRGAFEIRDMAQYFPALTASAQALGQTGVPAVADLAAALQITRKGAGDSASAANNLQNLLNKINTEDTIENFKQFGIDLPAALRRAAAEGKTPIEAIANLANQAVRGDLSKLSFLFGDAQVQAALRPLIQNMELYRTIRRDALAANGTVERDFAERMADTNSQASQLGATMQAVGHRVGNALLPPFNAFMGVLASVGERMNAWADANPRTASTLILIAAGIAVLAIGAGALAIAIGAILGPFALLRFAIARAGPALRLFGTVLTFLLKPIKLAAMAVLFFGKMFLRAGLMMLANPVVLAIVAIVAAIAGVAYLIYTYWDEIKAFFAAGAAAVAELLGHLGSVLSAIWDGICSAFAAVGAWFAARWKDIKGIFASAAAAIGGVLTAFGSFLAAAWSRISAIFASVGAWLAARWAAIKTLFFAGVGVIRGIFGAFGGFIASVWQRISGAFAAAGAWLAGAWENVKSIFSGAVQAVGMIFSSMVGAITNIWTQLKNAFNAGLQALADLPSRFYEFGRNILQGLINGLGSMLSSVWESISSIGSSIKTWFADLLGINSPSRVFMQFGGFLTEGLAIGLRRGAGGPLAQMRKIATAVAAAGAIALPAPAFADPVSPASPAAGMTATASPAARPSISQLQEAARPPIGRGVMDFFRQAIGDRALLPREPSRRPTPQPSALLNLSQDALGRGVLGLFQQAIAGIDRYRGNAETIRTAAAASPTRAPSRAVPGATVAPAPAPAGIGNLTLNIYGAPGQRPEDLAAAVRREVEALMRQEAAARRSSYDD